MPMSGVQGSSVERRRARITVTGAVQGVGFRPTVYRLATELKLGGWVLNSTAGVFIEVEGAPEQVDAFAARLRLEPPPRAQIESFSVTDAAPEGDASFQIRTSSESGQRTVRVLPDISTCGDCLGEVFDPNNRRYLYPFTNCTSCGPRYSIIEGLPYDRSATTMRRFVMCDACRREYENPRDRRFHAQPNACPRCGPQLAMWAEDGRVLATRHEALLAAVGALKAGSVVAIKGLGGFHLMVDARSDSAVARLRERKRRHAKPLAVMFPSLDQVRQSCVIDDAEAGLLTSPERPIVLLARAADAPLASAVAPGLSTVGAMLPYTPLHALLLRELSFPIVATSGNLSEEPICTDEHEALERLRGVADLFLVHDRPIARPVDDSVAHVVHGGPSLLRIGRGYAPLSVDLRVEAAPGLALGGHLKNTVAVSTGRSAFVSQHVGDLDTGESLDALYRIRDSLLGLYEVQPEHVACDLHPDYASTRVARSAGLPVEAVQHHHAHVAACMAEHGLQGRALGVAWDGTGFGTDGTVWGGEFLLVSNGGFERVGSLRTFPLPGGEAAVKEPRRSALGLLFAHKGESVLERRDLPALAAFSANELQVLRTMLARGVNAPLTSSVGRLFDAVAALCGVVQRAGFEGQAAMLLEHAAWEDRTIPGYPMSSILQDRTGVLRLDWGPMLDAIIEDVAIGRPLGHISARFHRALISGISVIANATGERRVVLTGGCFQNRRLLEGAVTRLREEGLQVYWPQLVPANDAGVALGQIAVAAARRSRPRTGD